MRKLRSVLLVATAFFFLVGSAAAQDDESQEHRRKGYWIGFGFGGGWSDPPARLSGQGRLRGGSAYLRMGGTPNPHFLFGGEVLVWWRDADGYDVPGNEIERVNVTATSLIYPGTDLDLFFKVGFGVSESGSGPGKDSEGVGLTLGSGYDIRLGNNFYLTPNADVMVHFLPSSTPWSLAFTLGFTWH